MLKEIAMKNLYFRPWIPPNFDGTLVIADSHYRGTVCPESKSGWGKDFDKRLRGSERNWTIAQVEYCISRKPGEYDPFYVRLKEVIDPNRNVSVADCFRKVAFATIFQVVLPKPSALRPWDTVTDSFRATLLAVKPRRVLIASKVVWGRRPGEEQTLIDDNRCRYGDVWVTWCYHPGRRTAHLFRKNLKCARQRFRTLEEKTKQRP